MINERGVRRIESPSSINTYKQCPRKYYLQYIMGLPTFESIHTIRGKIIHLTLENFFKIDAEKINIKNYENELKEIILQNFNQFWVQHIPDIVKLQLTRDQVKFYYDESLVMLNNFLMGFNEKIRNYNNFVEAFNILKPKTEVFFVSNELNVRGYIDAIHENNGDVFIVDYKTSTKDEITNEYRLQLAIYALLYHETKGMYPYKVGINFLRFGERFIKVNEELIQEAKKECKMIHEYTKSDKIADYPRNITPLCKWNGGKCDFYDLCFGQKNLEEFNGHTDP